VYADDGEYRALCPEHATEFREVSP